MNFREKLAALCHSQWAGWMTYLFSKGTFNKDGTWTMPREFVERWTRQMSTPYENLSPSEQDSDRKEADRFLDAMEGTKRVFVVMGTTGEFDTEERYPVIVFYDKSQAEKSAGEARALAKEAHDTWKSSGKAPVLEGNPYDKHMALGGVFPPDYWVEELEIR